MEQHLVAFFAMFTHSNVATGAGILCIFVGFPSAVRGGKNFPENPADSFIWTMLAFGLAGALSYMVPAAALPAFGSCLSFWLMAMLGGLMVR